MYLAQYVDLLYTTELPLILELIVVQRGELSTEIDIQIALRKGGLDRRHSSIGNGGVAGDAAS